MPAVIATTTGIQQSSGCLMLFLSSKAGLRLAIRHRHTSNLYPSLNRAKPAQTADGIPRSSTYIYNCTKAWIFVVCLLISRDYIVGVQDLAGLGQPVLHVQDMALMSPNNPCYRPGTFFLSRVRNQTNRDTLSEYLWHAVKSEGCNQAAAVCVQVHIVKVFAHRPVRVETGDMVTLLQNNEEGTYG
ncbi:uncharacterized protein [Triticum aestivum]|uniref:uncharacterized protein n=1 Tax=Triticum aestivum TaxID=4565 RepID=UPI001D004675|nr:uncharacterized protein LOC123154351 [Triticum aestivum]XP_044429043.1 uncharacterized protein LOC123154351 [Triticum aestivum]